MTLPRCVLVLAIALLCACTDTTPADTARVDAPWDRVDPGLLQNPGFDSDPDGVGLLAHWAFTQHGGEDSYQLHVDDGIARIRRIATQPWGQLLQVVDLQPYQGRRMRLSVQVAGEFSDEWGEPFEPSGLGLVIMARPDALSAFAGRQILATKLEPLPVELGPMDWTELAIEFDVPSLAGRSDISVRMSLGGELRVRNPALHLLPEPDPESEPQA